MEFMLNEVRSISDLKYDNMEFIDCYVSTDEAEVEAILKETGFKEMGYIKWADGSKYLRLISPSRLRIDCIEIQLEEALAYNSDIGFMAMSKFRAYTERKDLEKVLMPLIKGLKNQSQSFAFVTDSKVYKQL